MAFCNQCGASLREGATFCPSCGKKLGDVTAEQPSTDEQKVSEETGAAQEQPKQPRQPEQPEQPKQPEQLEQNRPSEAERQAPTAPIRRNTQPAYPQQQVAPVVSMGSFFGLQILFSLPLVGLIFLIIYACDSSKNPNKSNLAKANLLWMLVGIAISIVLTIVIAIFFADFIKNFDWSQYMVS